MSDATQPNAETTSESASVATPSSAAKSKSSKFLVRLIVFAAVTAGSCGLLWNYMGSQLWNEYKTLQTELRASEDNAPVGYIGLNYRRTYNDRPVVFTSEKDGKPVLFAAKKEDGSIDHYDLEKTTLDLKCLDGGYGRDSIPGIDYPIVESISDKRAASMRDRQMIFGLSLNGQDRAYPKDLLEKIEVVNDELDGKPIAVVYDRASDKVLIVDRMFKDSPITFGTSGYNCKQSPILYDRKSNSLWIPQGTQLVCQNGARLGDGIEATQTLSPQPWPQWKGSHRNTTVVVGSDRTKPIPSE